MAGVSPVRLLGLAVSESPESSEDSPHPFLRCIETGAEKGEGGGGWRQQEFERLPEPGLAVTEGSGHELAKASPDSSRAGAEAPLCGGGSMLP